MTVLTVYVQWRAEWHGRVAVGNQGESRDGCIFVLVPKPVGRVVVGRMEGLVEVMQPCLQLLAWKELNDSIDVPLQNATRSYANRVIDECGS